ncbi:hypothetical protein QOT17_019780 [Balamuthia mandrillaris]
MEEVKEPFSQMFSKKGYKSHLQQKQWPPQVFIQQRAEWCLRSHQTQPQPPPRHKHHKRVGTQHLQYLVLIKYKSGQSMGLAPAGKDSEAKAFWVSAVAEQDTGAFKWVSHKRVPSCPLTNHPIWRQPNGDILIKNFNGSMEDLEKLTKPFGRVGCYGMSGGGEGQPSEANVSFANAEEAQRAIAALNEVDFNGVKIVFSHQQECQRGSRMDFSL